jgi:hypothetical protein
MLCRNWRRRVHDTGRRTARYVPYPVTILAALLVLLPYSASYGDTAGNFTLVNKTSHYLHVIIGSTSFAFVAPGRSVAQEVGAPSVVLVDVAYSPGQGITGSASRSFDLMLEVSDRNSTDCSSTNRGNSCSSTINSSVWVEPGRWDVVPADLADDAKEE